MPSMPRELTGNSLNVYLDATTRIRQGLRQFAEEMMKVIAREIAKLLEAGFIREVRYTLWTANPVLGPKHITTKLRMCINFTGLNFFYLKDPYPLLGIGQVG
jgi:hypothetical protein